MPPGLKLKLGGSGGNRSAANTQPPTPAAGTPSGGSGFKLKLSSQPPTPVATASPVVSADTQNNADGTKKKRVYARKDKKRPADDDSISPAAKRVDTDKPRKQSLMLKLPVNPVQNITSAAAKTRINLKQRPPVLPVKKVQIRVKQRAPERAPGNAYDSEDSERERDPHIEQHLVLRMQPGEDCDYLRNAISEGKIGLPLAAGGPDFSLKFVDRDYRRAVITIRGRTYAAVLVDLPNIVETMKSWDKKGWYKVADLSQMLLVLGRCKDEHEAKSMPLPARIVDPQTMQYAHGLTPPMHWVRKRRFRKRLSYKDTANIEEEVAKLLADDDAAVAEGGSTSFEMVSRESLERSAEPEEYYNDEEDAEGEAMSTIENGYAGGGQADYGQYGDEEEMDVDAVAADLEDMFGADQEPVDSSAIMETPTTMADTNFPLALLQSTVTSPVGNETPAPAQTPAETPAAENSPSSDSDDYSSDDEEEVIDEDAQQRARDRAQQLEEIRDLEKEVEIQRGKLAGQGNQLLRAKMGKQLASLEEDLRIKRGGLGIGEEEEDGE